MSQMSLKDAKYACKRKQTRRELFLAEVEQAVLFKSLLNLVEPFYPIVARGRQPAKPRSSPFASCWKRTNWHRRS